MGDSPKGRKSPASPGSAKATPPPAAPASPHTPANLAANAEPLEADPDLQDDGRDNDADSLVSSTGGLSDTTSIVSSIFRFREENGRTYHAYKASEAAYFLPNDDRENERLDLQHNLFLLSQGNQLFLCPAGKDRSLNRVLDAGTGTGIWAVDFADENPAVAVVGVDLSPIQPSFVPPNLEFFVDDLESDWTFANPFDFVYMRMLTGSIRDWPKLIGQAYAHLNPGGYIELADACPLTCDDGTLPTDAPLAQWARHLVAASDKLGASMASPKDYKQQLIDAGFQDVVDIEYKWPTNTWPKDAKHKEAGAWTSENILSGLQGISLMLFTNVLGWSAADVETFLVGVRKDLRNRNIHAYWPVRVVYGRKPE